MLSTTQSKRPKTFPLLLFGIAALTAVLVSCTPREEGAAAQAESPTSADQSSPEETKEDSTAEKRRTITLSPTSRPAQETSDAPREESASRQGRSKDFLVAARPGEGYLPQQNRIGPLADRFSEDSDKRAVYRTVEIFFTSLEEGTLPTESILPAARTTLRRTLDYALTEGYLPRDFVLGAIVFSGTEARLNVALYGEPGSTAGELTVASDGGRWYISDIQVDFSQLAVEENEVARFEPVSYDWQIHSR